MDRAVFVFRCVQDIDGKLLQETDDILPAAVDGKHAVIQLIGELQVVDECFHVGGIFQYDSGVLPAGALLRDSIFQKKLRIAPDRG